MLKRHHRFFQSLQVIRDSFVVGLSFCLAYVVRFSFPETFPYVTVSPSGETLWVATTVMIVWPAVGWLGSLYVSRRSRSVAVEVFDVLKISVVAFVVLVTLTYFIRDERFSRGILLLWAVFSVITVSAARVASRVLLRSMRARGYNLRHVVVVGVGDMAQQVGETIRSQVGLGLRMRGYVAPQAESDRVGDTIDGLPVLGAVSELRSLLGGVDQVVVALPIEKMGELKEMMEVLSREPVDVRVVPDFYQYVTLYGSVDELAGMPIINLQATPLIGWGLVGKRAFDITVALLGLVAVMPLAVLIGLWVRITSKGPVLFAQERVGMDGRRFRMYKFRTMHADAEGDGARMTVPNDPRCTPGGAHLRRLSLDELPQLWNVLRGDMSLVGPRPERPCFIEHFKNEIPRYALRHKIKAGMTGWAQVHGMRGNTSIQKRIELDLYYIENWSLYLDVKILLRTVLGGFLSPNAY
jgi:Undecaprenyl-phosphate glucose phosphotransferase